MSFFKISLALQMAIATCLGILCGLFFGDLCDVLAPYAAAYIMMLKITAVPYLIGALMHGVGLLTVSQAKLILKKGIMFIGLAWFVNIAMIYLVYFTFPQPQAPQLGGYVAGNIPPINFAELLIPDNIFYDLSNNVIPAIVIFSLLIGIALMHLKEKSTVMHSLQNFVDALTRITGWIARITPIGTFIIIANQAGTIQFSLVKQVSTYLILYILCICVILFWIFPRIASSLTHIPSYKWLQQLFPILLLAYTTNVVIVCLPYIIELLRKETLAIDPSDEKAPTQIQGTVSVVFNLPLGSLFITIFVLFVSIFYSTPLALTGQIKLFLTSFLTSLGAVGIGSWINSLTFMLDSLGLPIEAINLFLTTVPFTSGFQAMISTMEIATLSLLITLACRKHIKYQYAKIIKSSVFTIVPVLLLFGTLKTFNPLPEIRNTKKSIYELSITSGIQVTIHDSLPPAPESIEGEDTFQRIMRTKTLRVGYNDGVAPFCFRNLQGHIVGYDIAFAYELAYDLGCNLELVPMTYGNVIKELKGNFYDIAMSSVSINEERLKSISFSSSYIEPEFVFLTSSKEKKHFSSLPYVKEHANLSIAVLKGSSFENVAKELFPNHKILFLSNYNDFPTSQADALLWEEQQAIAWSIRHREFRVVFPTPSIGKDTLSYAMRANNPRFLNYLNQWLQLKRVQGYTQKQYDLWILGKTEIVAPYEPRWSVIRDILHWIE